MKHTRTPIARCCCLLAVFLTATLFAADPPEKAASASAASPVLTVRAGQSWTDRSGGLNANQLLNSKMEVLDFRDAELQDVLRLIAAKSGLNILMNPENVSGKITLHLENVRLGVALDNILKVRQLAFVVSEDENIVRIVKASYVGRTGIETVTEVVYLKYLDAERITADLKTLFVQGAAQKNTKAGSGAGGGEGEKADPDRGLENVKEQGVGITYHRESNSLLITAPPPILADIKGVIATLDKPENQTPHTQTATVGLNWLNALELAEDLKKLFTDEDIQTDEEGDKFKDVKLKVKGVKEGVVRIVPQKAANAIIVTAPTPVFEDIVALIQELDKPQRQVKIEARLVDMTVGAMRELGTQLSMWRKDAQGNSPYSGQFTETQPGAPIIGKDALGEDRIIGYQPSTEGKVARPSDLARVGGALLPLAAGTGGMEMGLGEVVTIFDQKFNLSAQLRALEERQVVEVLANPRVVTLNKEEALMNVAQELPYTTSNVSNGVVQETVSFKNAGVKITVTPVITDNGYVRMNVVTDQSIYVGDKRVSTGDVPIIDRRETNTNTIVNSGDTIMTGGLRQLRSRDYVSGVPWLHQIPVLGWLFKVKNNTQNKNELFLFLTPQILENVTPTDQERGWYDRIDTKWNLPDYFFDDVKTLEDKH